MARKDPAAILLVEDDQNDVLFLRIALEEAGLPNRLIWVSTAQEAINYLDGRPPYDDRIAYPLPGLLVLDLNIRQSTAFEVLKRRHASPGLRRIPAVVLSGSATSSASEEARLRGASDFQIKPPRISELVALVQNWHSRWLSQDARP